jgi:amidase
MNREDTMTSMPPAERESESVAGCMTRREFITATTATLGARAGEVSARDAERTGTNASLSPLLQMGAVELAGSVRSRNVSCEEVMSAYLDHIDRFNVKVNAIVSLQDRDNLMQEARLRDSQLASGRCLGWMHGLPHAVKDLVATRGIRTTYGSPLLDSIPDHDAILVERLRRHGVIVIGKTNTPEFGLGSQTYNTLFGTTLNAYDQSKTSGGSSGGAAVALALRMVPVADGSDMMGSLRNPAAYNNVFGFRPSYGRVPVEGEELFLGQLSCSGAMGRDVADVAMLMSVIAGPDTRAPLSIEEDPQMFRQSLVRSFCGTRLGWLSDLGGHLQFEPGVLELCRQALKQFEALGCTIEEARLPLPPEKLWDAWLKLRHWLTAGELEALYVDPAKRARMKPEAQWEVAGGLTLSALDVYHASMARSEWYRAAAGLFAQFDFLLLPSAQVFPFDARVHWPQSINDVTLDTYHRWMEVVVPASLLSGPVLNVPVGFGKQGLPMGMQIIGRNHADFAVLQLGYAYDQATRWVSKRMPALIGGVLQQS